jgi:lysophospholipase L1-like esterase
MTEDKRKEMFAMKTRSYRELNRTAVKGKTVLAGSSLMELFPSTEMIMSRQLNQIVYNRGISGMTISEYREVLHECILDLQPSKLLINIGSNDLNLPGDTVKNLLTGYEALLNEVNEALPACKITLMAYYPCREDGPEPSNGRIKRTMANVRAANQGVRELAEKYGYGFIDFTDLLADEEGFLRKEIAIDAVHFYPSGYEAVLDRLEKYF